MYAIRSYYDSRPPWMNLEANPQDWSPRFYRPSKLLRRRLNVGCDRIVPSTAALTCQMQKKRRLPSPFSAALAGKRTVITSYSIHYTKLYDACSSSCSRNLGWAILIRLNALSRRVLPCRLAMPNSVTVITSYSIHYTKLYDWSPPYHHVAQVLIPTLNQLGFKCETLLNRWGWYPKGGGVIQARVKPHT